MRALGGVTETTYHNWIECGKAGESPFLEFVEFTREARASGRKYHASNIKHAASEDWRASSFFLERSDPDHWGRSEKVKQETSGEITIKVVYVRKSADTAGAASIPAGDIGSSASIQRRELWECFGKSQMAIHRLSETALGGEPGAYFAPTYKMLSDVWREFNRLLDPVIEERNVQEHRLGLLGGGIIDFWSLDQPNTARGRKYARAVIDEAAMIGGLEEAFNEVITPTLTDLHGDADLLSTPKGRNFFWRCYVRGQDAEFPEWASWTFPTLANEYVDPGVVESAKQQLPERVFRQEYLAEFLEESGGVFRGVNAVVDIGRKACAAEQGRSYTLGVDLARVEDFTVLSVMDNTGKQAYHERFNQISWERQCSTIASISAKYKAPIVLDSTGVGDPIYERLRQMGLIVDPYQFTNASKDA